MLRTALTYAFCAAALAAPAFYTTDAHADTYSITVNTNSQATYLVDKDGNTVSHSFISDHAFWVNLEECKADWRYNISVSVPSGSTYTIEVWAAPSGTDCSTSAVRYGATGSTASCWRVGMGDVSGGTYSFVIPVQNVVGQHLFGNGTATTTTVVPRGTEADCDTVAASGQSRTGVAIVLYFYVFGGTATATPSYSASWGEGGYDLVGPIAPASVSAKPADTEAYMDWDQVTDSDLAGYRMYCQPCVTGSGYDLCAAAGADAGSSQCDLGLTQGCLPDGDYLSGSISDKLAVSGIAKHLTNGVAYGCGVASYDTRQNSGVLSEVTRVQPWWVQDFFSQYRQQGGKAGGGFCSIGQQPSGFGLLIPLASLGLLALRRGRRLAKGQESRSGHVHSPQ